VTKAVNNHPFLPCDAMLGLYVLIACLSVRCCPSVCHKLITKMAKPRIAQTTPYDSPGFLVFWS